MEYFPWSYSCWKSSLLSTDLTLPPTVTQPRPHTALCSRTEGVNSSPQQPPSSEEPSHVHLPILVIPSTARTWFLILNEKLPFHKYYLVLSTRAQWEQKGMMSPTDWATSVASDQANLKDTKHLFSISSRTTCFTQSFYFSITPHTIQQTQRTCEISLWITVTFILHFCF